MSSILSEDWRAAKILVHWGQQNMSPRIHCMENFLEMKLSELSEHEPASDVQLLSYATFF